ncbi:aminoglycoside phosphotransferase family protein [Paraferrimonas sedimenticola]|uniref:Cell wall phosphotransferase n=1 Tax=Paraferrimonas sedimenticola TaxID=375674 RepID=A0AA37RXN5_9GAMM|nr:phosphotransferase [Paraferrimonas sedimenticola]GLP97339.1 cell wall phosphotransferase [Paraferrimonas sedimenticola]
MDARLDALQTWLANFCEPPPTPSLISGDASFRRYFRFQYQGASYIAVDAPPQVEDCQWFVNVALELQQRGITVPQVLRFDPDQGFMWLSDLGDTLLGDELHSESVDARYHEALALLPPIRTIDSVRGTQLPKYDGKMLEFEMSLFDTWLVENYLQLQLSPEQKHSLEQAKALLVQSALEQPQCGVHRDFHCRNLMRFQKKLAVIDFQGMVTGPITYDLVSLLRDCYRAWPPEQVQIWKHAIFEQMRQTGELPKQVTYQQFYRWFDWMGIQRHLKAAGIFCRLKLRDNKAGYLKDVALTLTYIRDVAADYQELAALSELIEHTVIPTWEARQ